MVADVQLALRALRPPSRLGVLPAYYIMDRWVELYWPQARRFATLSGSCSARNRNGDSRLMPDRPVPVARLLFDTHYSTPSATRTFIPTHLSALKISPVRTYTSDTSVSYQICQTIDESHA